MASLPRPVQGERYEGHCLTCDHEFDTEYFRDGWKIGSLSDRCPGGRECLLALADQLGCKPGDLLYDPRPYLENVAMVRGARTLEPQPLPTLRKLAQCRQRALEGKRPYRYLREQRGLSRATIVDYGVGYGRIGDRPPGFVFAVYDGGDSLTGDGEELVQVMIRHCPDPWVSGGKERKTSVLRGRGSWLWPDVYEECTVLCEGPFDALLARQHGLPCVTTTCGATLPEHLALKFCGRDVVVCYDVGADTRLTVKRLRAAGAKRVRVVDLGSTGLTHGEDLTDWFVRYGRTAGDLRRLIRGSKAVG